MDKKQIKNGFFEREYKSKKNKIRRKEAIQDRPFVGTKIDKKTSKKCRKNNHFGLFCTNKSTETQRKKKQNHQNQKSDEKKHFVHSGQPPPIFAKFIVFYQVHTPLMAAKLCFRWKHYKNSVFSAEHSFLGITDSKTPFRGPFPKWHFCNQKCHFGFYPCACWNPYFYSVLWLWMGTKKGPFSKNR